MSCLIQIIASCSCHLKPRLSLMSSTVNHNRWHQTTPSSLRDLAQKEEEDARKLYDEFVESFGDEPEQKASQRSFTRGGVIQPGSSASSAGAPLLASCQSQRVVLLAVRLRA